MPAIVDKRQQKRGPSPYKTEWRWSEKKLHAARLCAENNLSYEKISIEVGVDVKTLENWRKVSEFQSQIGDFVGEIQAGMLKRSIAKKHVRIKELDDLKNKLLKIIEERGFDDDMQNIPGGSTGLVLRKVKAVGTGTRQQIFDEYEPDTHIVRTVMSLHEQAARELGQWVDKTQVEDITRIVEVVGVDDDAFTTA